MTTNSPSEGKDKYRNNIEHETFSRNFAVNFLYGYFFQESNQSKEAAEYQPSLHAWMMVSAWNYGTYISGEQRQNLIRGESRGKTLVVLPKNLKVPICCGFLCGF